MKYVIYNTSAHAYVNWPGAKRAYTKDRLNARCFSSVAAAMADCCGDEFVVDYFSGNAMTQSHQVVVEEED